MLIVATLGVNCWLTSVALPIWHVERLGELPVWVLSLAGAGLAALAAGVAALARGRRWAAVVLAAVVPAAVLAPAAAAPTIVRSSVLSPAAVAIAGLSFAAYLVGACWACSAAGVRTLDSTREALDDHPRRGPKWLGVALLAFAAAIVGVALVAAHLRSFGDGGAGADVRTLSAAALALWAAGAFGVVAPALRHRHPWPLPAASRSAALVWLLVVVVAGAMLVLSMLE